MSLLVKLLVWLVKLLLACLISLPIFLVMVFGKAFILGGKMVLVVLLKRFAQQHPPSRSRGLREAALKRDGYRCSACGSTRQLHVHHVVPISQGGPDSLGNLLTLCQKCHQRAHHPLRGRRHR